MSKPAVGNKKWAEAGRQMAEMMAESVCLEGDFDLLPPVLERRVKEEAWTREWERELKYAAGRKDIAGELGPLTAGARKAFREAYVREGVRWVKAYVRELKDDGLLESRR